MIDATRADIDATENERRPLDGRRVLIVEDEVLVAFNIEHEVIDAGGAVVGPAHSLDEALALVDGDIDLAILDINLIGRKVFPVARALRDRGIPFLFASANCGDPGVADAGFGDAPCLDKPVAMARLIALAASLAR